MKNLLLKSVCIAAIALPFSAQMAKAATVTANLKDVTNTNTSNYPTLKVVLSDTGLPAGTVKVRVEVVPGPTGGIGDLRGVFFNLPSGVTGARITPIAPIAGTGGGPVTAVTGASAPSGVGNDISNSANLNGSNATFGVGVEVGRQGISSGDDFRSVEFTVSGNGLTLAGFANTQFGGRMMSVTTSANAPRDPGLSSKTLGNGGTVVATPPSGGGGGGTPAPSTSPSTAPSTPPTGGGGGGGAPKDVAEPITILGMGLGLGGLLLSRRNRNKNK